MENLRNEGWILSESSLKSIEVGGSPKNLIKTLLDRDLREIGAGISELHKGKFENLDHELAVLQILKIRNISAPKANESSKTAPKMLKLQLTDGVNTYSAIEMESTQLSIETKPGSKIALKVKQMKMSNGQMLLTPANIQILGGHVEALVSKWELTRSLAGMKGSRNTSAGGPPPFIPFGQKISSTNLPSDQRGFKSLQPAKPKESENDDSEFKAQRQDAIAEANKAGTKKTFGGGSKTLIDSNVQKVMDKGYTEEQATTALKYSRNNVEKALIIIKRREDQQKRASSNDYEPREYLKEKRGGKDRQSDDSTNKPTVGVSLFSFLENKMPSQPETTAKHSSYSNERFENNMSSSFRKNDKDFSNNSQHWSSQHSSNFNEQKSSQNFKNSNSYNSRENRDGGRGDYRNHRDSRDTRELRENRDGDLKRDGDSRKENKYQSSNSNYQSKPSTNNQYQKPSNVGNIGANNNFINASANKGKYQKPEYNNKPGSHNQFPSSADTSNGKYDSSKSRNNNSSSKYYNEHQSNDYHKSTRNVVDSLEKMNLKGNNQPYRGDARLNTNNYPPLTPATEVPKQKSYSQPGYPIVGFQNKEANETAKNALKTKNIPGAPQQQQQQQPHQKPSNWQQRPPAQTQHSMPVNVVSQQTMKTQPPPPFPSAPGVAPPTPMHTLPQPFVQHQGHSMIHAMPGGAVMTGNPPPNAVFHTAINYPTPIIMQTVPPPPGIIAPVTQQLKSGDLCLAKYWEDGQFYQAKITAVSENTYVVLFPEYGNAEEVRKSDCLPYIQTCPTPPHAAGFPAPQMNATYRIPTQKTTHHNNFHNQQQQQSNSSMPYKGPVKNHRRNYIEEHR